jgi:hypothetical protein
VRRARGWTWRLGPVAILMVLTMLGGENAETSYQPRARIRVYRCPKCKRVERSLLLNPVCPGTEEPKHNACIAEAVTDSPLPDATDKRHLFRRGGRGRYS